MSGITRYVKYFIAPRVKGKTISVNEFNNPETQDSTQNPDLLWDQQQAIEKFLNSKVETNGTIGEWVDSPDNRRTTKWPQLKKAIKQCVYENAALLIAELGTFTNNETFAKLLLDSNIQFHCCDQPFVDRNILEALYKHAQIQKKVHGKLIRDGLKMTSAKSGNPNAAEVIGKVNKPKIHTAIVFAEIISPIINDYVKKGYSQRQMVKMLNEENFTAPEGGKWVLSQLQKVLDRVKLNNIAKEIGPIYKELKDQGNTDIQIAEELNNRGISPIKRTPWDESQILKLQERLEQIDEINWINQFIDEMKKVSWQMEQNNITPKEFIEQLKQEGVKIKQEVAEV